MMRLLLLFLCLPASTAFAQAHTEYFQLATPENKVSGSLYSNLQLLDVRPDTTSVGMIQTGMFNRQTALLADPGLHLQLPLALRGMVNAENAQPGTLLLRLRQFRISELTSGFNETGYCALQADLLVNTGGHYQMLARVDTLVQVRGGVDITKATLRNAEETLLHFLSSNLTRSAAAGSPLLTLAEVQNLDSVEKRSIPLYNVEGNYTNGLYKSYEAFAAQRPSIPVTAEVENGKLFKVRTFYPAGGKGDKVKPGGAYAIVYEGIPYIGTNYGFYRLHKRDDDFLFVGKLKVNADNGADVFVAGLAFGVVGGLLISAASVTTKFYRLKLDHRNGRPVFIDQVL